MNTAELDAIRQRVEAATKASSGRDVYVTSRGGVVLLNGPFPTVQAFSVGEFHKHAYTDIPTLLAEVIRLRSALVEVELAAGRQSLAEVAAIAAAALGEEKQA